MWVGWVLLWFDQGLQLAPELGCPTRELMAPVSGGSAASLPSLILTPELGCLAQGRLDALVPRGKYGQDSLLSLPCAAPWYGM